MASRILYPPILANYAPAFKVTNNENTCFIEFSLSKFNIASDFKSIHISVMKQGSGLSVINPIDGSNRQRKNGKMIIVNQRNAGTEKQSIAIMNEDIKGGQEIGTIYKVQIRLSKEEYTGDGSDQNEYLNNNAFNFSEWSTVCVIKPIGLFHAELSEPFPSGELIEGQNVDTNIEGNSKYSYSTLELYGRIQNDDSSEKLRSYSMQLFKIEGDIETLLEDSGEIFSNKYQDNNEFSYFFKKDLKEEFIYKIVFNFTSINGYIGKFVKTFQADFLQIKAPDIRILTIDTYNSSVTPTIYHSPSFPGDEPSSENPINENSDSYEGLTSIMMEEEEGRIGIKLKDNDGEVMRSCNLCVRRSDERSNFEDQEDIKIIVLNDELVSDLDVFYDYTIESGVYYKYGLQEIDRNNHRSLMREIEDPIVRDFQYSFILGEGGKQLKLKFDNTMQNYKIQQLESKMETIGSKYPIVTRNAAVEYKTFPIAGLISFQMDDNKLFYTKDEAYGEYIRKHQSEGQINREPYYYDEVYDYNQEKDFRNQVLKFLQDGKPKLFKSPTEGNIIVRLMDVNCTPNQSLDRMLYSFTSNAFELAEANMENYLKYNFYEVGTYQRSFVKTVTKIGQIILDFKPLFNGEAAKATDIINEIYSKYDSGSHDMGGYINTITKIYGLKITINSAPLRMITADNTYIQGHQIKVLGGSLFTSNIFIKNGIYEFDSMIGFNKNNKIYFMASADYNINPDYQETINASIDFLYDVAVEKNLGKIKATRTVKRGIGQIVRLCDKDYNLRAEISGKYKIDTSKEYRSLDSLTAIEIEADPGCVFAIGDSSESLQEIELHEMNDTSILRFYNLSDNIKYIFYRYKRFQDEVNREQKTDETTPQRVVVTYYYTVEEGEYEQQTAQPET